MAQPQWITPAGSLGTIPEGVFYSIPIEATADPETVYYQVIAGQLPAGIYLNQNGLLSGIPQNIITIQGVPTLVSQDVTSKFVIRAYTTTVIGGVEVIDRLSDRTFLITVTGQDVPDFITPAGNIGTFYDGTAISIQLQYTDVDPLDNVQLRVTAGELPLGLVLTNTGLITGVIQPLTNVPGGADPGFDNTTFSQYPFDFATRSASRNYQFVVTISDGKSTNLRSFEIYVYSKDSMSADTTDFTADNDWITADVVPSRNPVLVSPIDTFLGNIRSDNFYATKFDAVDWDGDQIEYIINTLPPGLTLNSTTGWLYGYIPNLGITEISYSFEIVARKLAQPSIQSEPRTFNLTIVGAVGTTVSWVTPPDLGSINNGAVSTLAVEAVNLGGRPLQYRLASGSNSQLPQGLTLLPSGYLSGAVSFNTFAIDGGTTTFDVKTRNFTVTDSTTFDMLFTFTVNAYLASNGEDAISIYRTFTLRVVREFNAPYQDLYIKAMPPITDRDLIAQLVQNQDILPIDLIYRNGDPYFGVASSVIYYHAYGLNPAAITDYVAALELNHYWKNLTLGGIEYAQAKNANGEVIYEAVYSRVIDNLVNDAGQSVSKNVNWPVPIGDTGIKTVYPNSLINMRDQVVDNIGQVSPMLPAWMTSKQADGSVLGFVPAWVIAYVKPGQGPRVVYNIQQQFGNKLNTIDFKADRYELDRRMTFAWDEQTDSWIPGPPAATTFDLVDYTVIVTWVNNASAPVTWINNFSSPVNWGNPDIATGTPTIFDGGSTTFIDPADTVTTSDVFDKYLLFPKINILG